MLNFIFYFLLILHGLIHLLGFVEEWKTSSGDFTWLKLDVTEVEHTIPAIY